MEPTITNNKFILALFLVVSLLMVSSSFNYAAAETKYAVFDGGCFWCMEPPFEKVDKISELTAN